MKKIISILLMMLVSCSSDDCLHYNTPSTPIIKECPTIFSIGEDDRGNFIIIGFNHNNTTDRTRYKVVNYKDYKLGGVICNFSNLTEQEL